MLTAIVICFALGYLAIALEHPLHIDKAASALILAVTLWSIYAINLGALQPPSAVPGWFTSFLDSRTASVEAPETLPSVSDESIGTGAGAEDAGLGAAADYGNGHSDDHDETHDGSHDADADHADEGHAGGHHDGIELSREYMIEGQLRPLLGEISEILFFLLGAMTIVEIVDANEGFKLITDRIDARNKVKLMWVTSWLAFVMSAVLDNLTSTIVMVSLLKKLIADDSRKLFVGMVVVAANAGGAWTVIGDVTTTMLWIGGKISVIGVMQTVVLPSVVCLLVPLLWLSFTMDKTPVVQRDSILSEADETFGRGHQLLFLLLGLTLLLSVPVFKIVTHLPPFVGMMGALGILWTVSDLMRRRLDSRTSSSMNVITILRHVDTASLLFFLGILLAVGCLAATGQLEDLARWTRDNVQNESLVAVLIGLGSAVIDNVPLVAAGIKMFTNPVDAEFWHLLAYCAGTGGSCLIIGSAAGVAAMGLDSITFGWYLRKIAPLALAGYLAGVAVFLVQAQILAML